MNVRDAGMEQERDEPPDRPGPSHYPTRPAHHAHSRAASVGTPPAPPPFFNPPADLPPDPIEGVLTPPPPNQFSPPFGAAAQAFGHYSPQRRASPSPRSALEDPTERPQLRSLQRISAESVPTPQSTGSSAASSASEGGDHLIEAREKLRSDASEAGSAGHSRRTSGSSAGDRGEDGIAGLGVGSIGAELQQPRPQFFGVASSPQFNLISPTPPLVPQGLSAAIEAGPSTRRMSLPVVEMEQPDLTGEHAWDSVWPAPGTALKSQFPPDIVSRFPTAPMSPFITPAFSPAVISSSQGTDRQRRPSSPGFLPRDFVFPHVHPPPSQREPQHRSSSPSPLRISPRRTGSPSVDTTEFALARRRSITAHTTGPPITRSPSELSPVTITKHSRSHSSSSPTLAGKIFLRDAWEASKGGSPPMSPPRSPSSRSAGKLPAHEDSSSAINMRKQFSNPLNAAALASRRASLLGTSPTSLSGSNFGRPRGRSFGSQSVSPKLSPSAMAMERPARLASLREDSGSGQSVSLGESPVNEPLDRPSHIDIPDLNHSEISFAPTPIALPPPISQAPVPSLQVRAADDGMPRELHGLVSSGLAATAPVVPTLQSIMRPGLLRRAMSEQDTRIRANNIPTPTSLLRAMSTAEVERSPKRNPSELDAGLAGVEDRLDLDVDQRKRKSPKLSGSATMQGLVRFEPDAARTEDGHAVSDASPYFAHAENDTTALDTPMEPAAGQFADAGDVLPSDQALHPDVDVTFDDEGLSTLERIFLLSNSEYAFHRRYIAGVLGDLLYDVDPCESVEYVLPLLSAFAMDDAEDVKEEFARELHRILWYFISMCKLIDENDHGDPDEVFDSPGESSDEQGTRLTTSTVTITSQGMEFVPTPSLQQATAEAETVEARRGSITSGVGTSSSGSATTWPSSVFSNQVAGTDTPASTADATPSSVGTAFSPSEFVNPFTDQDDPEKEYVKDIGPLKKQPSLAAHFFTPLLGSLLLSGNAAIADSIRQGLVLIFARLKGKQGPDPERWGHRASLPEPDERRSFNSQEGLHCHDIHPFDRRSRVAAERALMDGIVLGMGSLSTEMPEHLHESSEEGMEDERELYQEQLMQEASTGRATSMNLIGSLCEIYSGPEAVLNGFVEEVLRAGDGDALVRAEAAVAVGSLAKIVPLDQLYRLIPLFEFLISDETSHVRQSACVALPALCRRIESAEYRRDFAVRSVLILVDSGPDVKCAVLEMMGEIIYVFHQDVDGPPDELLRVYMDDEGEVMNGERDSDWDIVASFNFPGVCLTLGPSRWHELRDLYIRLHERAGEKVFRSLSASLHELAKILEPEQVHHDLLPVWHRCFEEGDGVRERVFEHVSVTLSNLPWQVGWQEYLDMCMRWRDNTLGGWRVREQLALHLPRFMEVFGKHTHLGPALEMTRQALLDPFAAVRDAATKGVPDCYMALQHGTQIATDFREMLLDLANSSAFRQRLTFVRCLREFCRPPPNRKAFEEFFLPHLPRLAQDVVDVRLGLAQIVADLFVIGSFYGVTKTVIPPAIQQLANALAHDDAVDVRDTIRHVNLAAVARGEVATPPYKVEKEVAEPRRISPSDLPAGQGSEKATISALAARQTDGSKVGSALSVHETKDSGMMHSKTMERIAVPRRPSAEMVGRMGQLGMSTPKAAASVEGEMDPFERSFSESQGE